MRLPASGVAKIIIEAGMAPMKENQSSLPGLGDKASIMKAIADETPVAGTAALRRRRKRNFQHNLAHSAACISDRRPRCANHKGLHIEAG